MADHSENYKIISCNCDDLVNLTSKTDLTSLDSCLLEQIKIYLPNTKVQLVKSIENEDWISEVDNHTNFELSIGDKLLGHLIVPQKISEELVKKIINLCTVYVNQYSLISRINHDQLTKLGNRQGLNDKFAELFNFNDKNKRKKETNYYIAIFDIDHFKRVNDNFGHLYGDEVLLQLSQLMTKTFRDQDYLYRYGGEEFVAILGDIDLKQAKCVMERFRTIVAEHQFPLVGHITISIGLTYLDKKAGSIAVLEQADKALYFAKENGRNQLRVYQELIESGDLAISNTQNDDITLF